MSRLALIGGEGFAAEVQELAEVCGHEVVGYVALSEGQLRLPYWGTMDQLPAHREQFDAVCIAFCSIDRRTAGLRAEVIRWVTEQGFSSVPLVSPQAVCSREMHVADGAIVAPTAVISLGASIGPWSIVNTGAIVGHHSAIDTNVTLAPRAFLAGAVKVGDNTLVGPSVQTLQGLQIGRDCVISIGATVLHDVADSATVMPGRSWVMS